MRVFYKTTAPEPIFSKTELLNNSGRGVLPYINLRLIHQIVWPSQSGGMKRAFLLALALGLAAHAAQAQQFQQPQPEWQGKTAAFFGVHLIDTSTEGEINGIRPDETARTRMIEDYVADAFREKGLELVDLGPVEEELARTIDPAVCNDCDLRMAEALGADYSIVSQVQKVSNLILAINIYVREVGTGERLRGQAVDIRGNNDESWIRGARYILQNNVFDDD